MPFRLKLNHVSQFKYTNTHGGAPHLHTHLGVVKEVLRRNDIQLTRDVFYFSGYVFDRRLDFNILLYTSSATLSATAAGYVGYVFSKAFALRAGFFSLPSVRSMTGTYPFFHGTDRSMATNYMRPGFTQGVWANGELFPGFNYIAMIGNSLNTLDIAATKIDYNFAYSASVWYDGNKFGKAWNDYEHHASRRCAWAPPSPSRARIACRTSRRPARRTTPRSSRTARCSSRPERWRPASPFRSRTSTCGRSTAGSSTAASLSTSSSTTAGSTTSPPTARCRSAACSTGASMPRSATS